MLFRTPMMLWLLLTMISSSVNAQLFPAVTRAKVNCGLSSRYTWTSSEWNRPTYQVSMAGVSQNTSETIRSFQMLQPAIESGFVKLRDVSVVLQQDGTWIVRAEAEHLRTRSTDAGGIVMSSRRLEIAEIRLQLLLSDAVKDTGNGTIGVSGGVAELVMTDPVKLHRGEHKSIFFQDSDKLVEQYFQDVRRVQVQLKTRK